MSKQAKIWLIIGASLVLIGCIIFGCVMTLLKWDFTKLQTAKYETNHYEITENYKNISIITDTADIVLLPFEGSKSFVECFEQENIKHCVTVTDDTLTIQNADTRKWYEHIGIAFNTPKITVYIPQDQYGVLLVNGSTGDIDISKNLKFKSIDIAVSTGSIENYACALEYIKLKTSTGSIHTKDIRANSLDFCVSTGKISAQSVSCEGDIKIKVSTGDTKLIDVSCKDIVSSGSTGDISLKNVLATGKISIERTTADVKLDSSDAAQLFIKTDTGDVTGSLLSEKVFITQTDTGRVFVPKTLTGGKCEIITDTGNIKIDIQP